ncbi:unnamed protein product [Strongylus vulgaris]|uniref:BRCT domain-containing protein n=1 Tax=Strongylus vulgaris TaxID=40348 RepID=A0A3P7LD98_STRVU|nr:unnamed protein product [Strongylus vulgaris]
MSKEHRIRKKIIVSLGSTIQRKEWPDSLLDVGIRIKTFSSRTKYLVAASVTDSYYRRAIALGIFVVKEEFLERCENIDSLMDISELAESCKLPRFAGLAISFLGFNDETAEDYDSIVEENGGHVTMTTSEATHIIVAPEFRPPAACQGKNLVTMEVRSFSGLSRRPSVVCRIYSGFVKVWIWVGVRMKRVLYTLGRKRHLKGGEQIVYCDSRGG